MSMFRRIPSSVKVIGAALAVGWMVGNYRKKEKPAQVTPIPVQDSATVSRAAPAPVVAAVPPLVGAGAPVAYAQPKQTVEPVPAPSGPVAAIESVGQTLKSGRQDAAASSVISSLPPHSGGEAVEIGSFRAGGIMFKDNVKVVAINGTTHCCFACLQPITDIRVCCFE